MEGPPDEDGLKLDRLHSALESGKVDIDDLAPRLKVQRAEQRELYEKREEAFAEAVEPSGRAWDVAQMQEFIREIRSALRARLS